MAQSTASDTTMTAKHSSLKTKALAQQIAIVVAGSINVSPVTKFSVGAACVETLNNFAAHG
jgi:hypothetical protein